MKDNSSRIYLSGHNSRVPLVKESDISYFTYFSNCDSAIVENISNSDVVVFVEVDPVDLKKIKPNQKIFLIRNETEVVWPANHSKRFLKRFDHIINVGRPIKDESSNFPWPQNWNQINFIPKWKNIRLERIVLINGNKISFVPEELYSLRRECIHKIDALDLFGVGWEISTTKKIVISIYELLRTLKNGIWPEFSSFRFWLKKPLRYLGTTEDKLETLSNYKYALVIENSKEFMTEKLFDSFFAGCIPIYVGPRISDFSIPENLVIQVDSDFDSINLGINEAKKINYENWKSDLINWITSSDTESRWSSEYVYPKITEKVISLIKAESV